MKLPIAKRLKKRRNLEIALLQDEIVEILYNINENLVFHGGTAIWRCYGGNRFSEDLDFYGNIDEKKFKREITNRQLTIKKFKHTENLIFSKVSNGIVDVRIEINKVKAVKKTTKSYERVDGSFFDVYSLTIDDLIIEKINAYENRRFIRDLYDIYFLAHFGISEKTKEAIKRFLRTIQRPVDEEILKAIVYSGTVPSFNSMIGFLERI